VTEENLVTGTLEGFWVEKREGMLKGGRKNTRGSSGGQYVDRYTDSLLPAAVLV
jgi:hypothetical protein